MRGDSRGDVGQQFPRAGSDGDPHGLAAAEWSLCSRFAPGGRMLGFVFGITGPYRGELSHWSDLLAVRPDARGTHVGERLKRYQRDLCRNIGVGTIYWTFDPLVRDSWYEAVAGPPR